MQPDSVRSDGRAHDHTLLAALKTRVVPSLFVRKLDSDTVRVWVPGCATGEVVYVVASLLQDYAQRRNNRPTIQVFATDSDPNALMAARLGQYPETLAATLPSEWLGYFFHDEWQHYHVTAAVRNLITFAQHQLLRDPPFAHLDLIICGNLLAAFSQEAQNDLLQMFHWSLRPQGYLMLSAGEDAVYLSEFFILQDRGSGVFQRRSIPAMVPRIPYRVALLERERVDEPLRAANEHLQAMNQALRRKVGELAQVNNDLNNLMSATNLATLFLDRKLQVTRFTAHAQTLFNLIPADQGRPLAHITHTLDYPQLVDDATYVLESLQSSEREVRCAAGRWYLVRMRPYRTIDERIDGLVLIAVDITERRLAEAEVRRARDELELRVRERTRELSTANTQLQIEIAERVRLEQERTELLYKLVLAQEDERRRLARELHDQLGQSVSALGLGLGMLLNPAVEDAQHQQIVARLQHITAQIDQDMKRLATELRPTLLDDLGLIEAVQHQVERWAEHTGIQAEFQAIAPEAGRLPREIESVIYRVIQEALTNVLKHAQAGSVSVILEKRRDLVRVIVEDDGCGFDLDALEQAPNVRQRLGLLGMRERVALVGGAVTIETAPGAGTTLFVQLPIPARASFEGEELGGAGSLPQKHSHPT